MTSVTRKREGGREGRGRMGERGEGERKWREREGESGRESREEEGERGGEGKGGRKSFAFSKFTVHNTVIFDDNVE